MKQYVKVTVSNKKKKTCQQRDEARSLMNKISYHKLSYMLSKIFLDENALA